MPVDVVAKKHGVSAPTLYAWKRKFGGMDVEDAKRLKVLEHANAKLKKLLAERMLDIEVRKDGRTSTQKTVSAPGRRR